MGRVDPAIWNLLVPILNVDTFRTVLRTSSLDGGKYQNSMDAYFKRHRNAYPAATLFAVHLLVGGILYLIFDIRMSPDHPFDYYWQALPEDSLAFSRLPESLWYLHAQPPLYNLYGALFINLFPDQYLLPMHIANLIISGLMVCLFYALVLHIVERPGMAFVISLVVQSDLTWFLYAAFLNYTLLTAFFILLSGFLLVYGSDYRRLYAFIAVLNLVVLTRALFHPLLLIPAAVLAAILAGAYWRRVLLVTLVISGVSFGWVFKNAVVFGFWGTTSWTGQNLWHIVSEAYPPDELEALAGSGIIPPFAAVVPAFSRPSAYVPFGFDRESESDVLRGDHYNNINILDISDSYLDASLRLIRRNPFRYLTMVAKAYLRYTSPISNYWHEAFVPNVERVEPLHQVQTEIIEGQGLFRQFFGYEIDGSFLTLLLPLILLGYGFMIVWGIGLSPVGWVTTIRQNPLGVYFLCLVVYAVTVSITTEFGENMRFRLLVHYPILLLTIHFIKVMIIRANRLTNVSRRS